MKYRFKGYKTKFNSLKFVVGKVYDFKDRIFEVANEEGIMLSGSDENGAAGVIVFFKDYDFEVVEEGSPEIQYIVNGKNVTKEVFEEVKKSIEDLDKINLGLAKYTLEIKAN
ncbi:hypothetical protein A73_172 [Escherichia phage A73]|uniref:Uncharacterized protein n=1 Tax=Escherichia phage A73 TaxID=3003819 RepID=A0AAE9VXG6_9CAUD|nr:hypothetical protein A73_172 [Escherichia phage A73]WBF78034.1 hypothetical protein W70_157 [Escherichia phage W70]